MLVDGRARWSGAMGGASLDQHDQWPVTISGHAGKVMPWGKKWGGGVQTQIVVDGTTLFRAAIENQREDYSIDANLKVGSLVDFLIGPNPSVGVIEFTATVRTAPIPLKRRS